MKHVTILLFLLLALLGFAVGCTSNNAQINRKSTFREKSVSTTVQHKKRGVQGRDEIPLLLTIPEYNAAQTELVRERALLGHWNIQTGSVFFERKLLHLEQFMNDPMWANNNDEMITLSSPPPGVPSEVLRLYFSGNSKEYIELATYDVPAENQAETGRLILGDYSGSRERWRKVNGNCPSLIVAYSPDVAKVGNKIYIDDKRGYSVKAIDLKKEPLELIDYAPANELIREIKDELVKDSPEVSPLGFGSHQNILIITAGGNTKWWIWAIQDDACIGKIFINIREKKLVSYKGDKVVCTKRLFEEPGSIRLPRK